MKRMLVNATQPEELRVAMVDGQTLYDLDIEVPGRAQKKANIYKAKITRIEPSLEAAFVEYGGNRHGFLPFKEISPLYFKDGAAQREGRVTIREALSEGQELVVQVDKEERGTKGAALTTFISLAGRYLVLMPNNPRAGGISRRVEGEERSDLREALSTLDVPDGMGLIVRTAGVGQVAEDLQWDLDYLLQLWRAVEAAGAERSAPDLLFQESNVIIRALRDYFRQDIAEVLVDTQEVYEQARDFMQQVMPANAHKVKLYEDTVPLFSRYQIESRIEAAFGHEARLSSGGSIVIDHTEALVSIDINSARATKGSDIEETALNTNLEAADEIARQLRIRDIGGLIVIDFIDMGPARNQREVENRLRDALQPDRARVQIGRISRFGLLEMSRQRLRPSLGESSLKVCPRCHGQGYMRGNESLSLSVLRVLEEEAMKDKTGRVVAKVPLEMGTFLLNEKRDAVHEIQSRHRVDLIIVPDPLLETPNYEIERVRSDDADHISNRQVSYELATTPDTVPAFARDEKAPPSEEPAVRRVSPPAQPARPTSTTATGQPGIVKRFITAIFGADHRPAVEVMDETATSRPAQSNQKLNRSGSGSSSGGAGNNRRRSNSRRRPEPQRDKERPADGNSAIEPRASTESAGSKDANSNIPSGQNRGASGAERGPGRRAGGRQDNTPAEIDTSNEQEARTSDPKGQNGPAPEENPDGERPARSRRGGRRGRRGGRQRRGVGGDVAAAGEGGASTVAQAGPPIHPAGNASAGELPGSTSESDEQSADWAARSPPANNGVAESASDDRSSAQHEAAPASQPPGPPPPAGSGDASSASEPSLGDSGSASRGAEARPSADSNTARGVARDDPPAPNSPAKLQVDELAAESETSVNRQSSNRVRGASGEVTSVLGSEPALGNTVATPGTAAQANAPQIRPSEAGASTPPVPATAPPAPADRVASPGDPSSAQSSESALGGETRSAPASAGVSASAPAPENRSAGSAGASPGVSLGSGTGPKPEPESEITAPSTPSDPGAGTAQPQNPRAGNSGR